MTNGRKTKIIQYLSLVELNNLKAVPNDTYVDYNCECIATIVILQMSRQPAKLTI